MAAVVWLVVAVGLAILEVLSLDLVLVMLAAGALAGGIAAAAGAPLLLQVASAVGVAALGLVAVRPVALRHLRKDPEVLTGSDALVGRRVKVLRTVTSEDGLVKIGGEDWTARLEEAWDPLPVGETGTVVAIEGATAIIRPY